MANAVDERFMALALALGRRGLGRCWPNPAVGCVIVNDGRIVGRGHTAPGGRPHGEVIALGQAGALARGATAYVGLEPCAHTGQTPPCATALIEAGVARVVAPLQDSDARVAGAGFAMLRNAGIDVATGVLSQQAALDHRGFFLRIEKQRPMVTLKLASSFDGRIATATGESRWITGAQARRAVHGLRATHDAVMIGAGTARADDPMLTVRDMGFPAARQPVRVVLSRWLELPLDSRLARSAREVPLWICHGPDAAPERIQAWQSVGARLFECASEGRQIMVRAALEALAEAGLTRVFCEGGGALAASLLLADLVDDLVGFFAGTVLGAEGQPSVGALGIDALSQAPRFALVTHRQMSPDLMALWRRVPE